MDFSQKETTSSQPTTVVRKRSAWSTVAFMFALLMLMALGAFAWAYYMWQSEQKQVASKQSEISSLQSSVTSLHSEVSKATGKAEAEASQPANDEAAIRTQVLAHNASLATPLKDAKVELTERKDSQALATVSNTTASYKAYVKKTTAGWVVVWSGSGKPSDDVVERYGLKL